jgi:hypothetical protein
MSGLRRRCNNTKGLLGLTVYGRQAAWEDSPTGWPQRLQGKQVTRTDGRRPTAQWSRLEAGRSDNLGVAYGDLPTGDRGDNLRRAIICYEAALRAYTERDFPQDWAMTQHNLDAARAELESLTSK